MTSPSAQAPSVLRYPNVLRFIAARFLATLAAQIQIVAVGWQMYDITGDPLDLGLIGLSQFIPFVALILPAGASMATVIIWLPSSSVTVMALLLPSTEDNCSWKALIACI
ncbi:MAG: hypothetical protein SXG53_12945, partial [Pseudomonadota bacterium]|nr:hypothetical protein [Pseudomonadota bacterium]